MFERYIRVLSQEIANKYSVRAENGLLFPLTFYSSYGPNINVKPDIIFRYGGSAIMVIDVKYKTFPTDQDHYQLWAYMQAYGVKQGGFISLVDPLSSHKPNTTWYERDTCEIFNFPFDCVEIKEAENRLDDHLVSIFERVPL